MLKFYCGTLLPLKEVKSVKILLSDVLSRWQEVEKWELAAKDGETRRVHYQFTPSSGLGHDELRRRAHRLVLK